MFATFSHEAAQGATPNVAPASRQFSSEWVNGLLAGLGVPAAAQADTATANEVLARHQWGRLIALYRDLDLAVNDTAWRPTWQALVDANSIGSDIYQQQADVFTEPCNAFWHASLHMYTLQARKRAYTPERFQAFLQDELAGQSARQLFLDLCSVV